MTAPTRRPYPTVGTITSRHLALKGYSTPIILPALDDSKVYNNVGTTLVSGASLYGRANWALHTSSGNVSLTLRQTNGAATDRGSRRLPR